MGTQIRIDRKAQGHSAEAHSIAGREGMMASKTKRTGLWWIPDGSIRSHLSILAGNSDDPWIVADCQIDDPMTITSDSEARANMVGEANFPAGPYYVGADNASDCPAHSNSGLAMVDTVRSDDWPVARLCEWPMARRIALALNCHDELLNALKLALTTPGMIRGRAEAEQAVRNALAAMEKS